MAESKQDKKQNPQDSFADDLDSMLNLDETSEQQVGLVDDEDAIDRLLIDDAFQESQDESAEQSNNIDQLLADNAEFDEFGDDIDDLLANIKPSSKQAQMSELEELPALDTVSDDEVDLTALETVGEVEGLTDEIPAIVDDAFESSQIDEELENMAEIDEFTDEPEYPRNNNADFLMADFDISADEDAELTETPEVSEPIGPELVESQPQPEIIESVVEQEALVSQEETDTKDEENVVESPEVAVDQELAPESPDAEELSQAVESEINLGPEPDKIAAEQLAALAAITNKIEELLKQQALISQEMQQKASKDELNACLDTVDTLQTEQKKSKRNIEAVNSKKPVAAYVALGIAVLALIVGGGLGYQGYAAKSQITKLIEIMDRFQAQLTSAPGAEAEEKEMLRNQLDELSRVTSENAEQIAELNKAQQEGVSSKPNGDATKQPTDLMQIGAAIETLQNKVSALEKGKQKVVAKPVPKKPVVAQENWVVNLVAFKQDWYAKRKAEEFAAKGVPAKVVKADSKGEIWYRLSVDGFSSQYEAAAYAARVKKNLNLDSVWLNKNKK